MSTQPVENLENRAEEQRRQIHATAEELRDKISLAKEKFDVGKNIQQHLFAICITAGAAALLVGTAIARKFKK